MPLDHMNAIPTLATLGHGDRATVLDVAPGDQRLVARLAARGLVPGARVAVLRAGDPLLLKIETTKWAINRQDAAHITVDVERRGRNSFFRRLRGA